MINGKSFNNRMRQIEAVGIRHFSSVKKGKYSFYLQNQSYSLTSHESTDEIISQPIYCINHSTYFNLMMRKPISYAHDDCTSREFNLSPNMTNLFYFPGFKKNIKRRKKITSGGYDVLLKELNKTHKPAGKYLTI